MLKLSLMATAVLIFTAGCTMEPKYQQPVAPVDQTFPTGGIYDKQPDASSQASNGRSALNKPAPDNRLARFLCRSAPAADRRARAQEQPRPAGVDAERGSRARASTRSRARVSFRRSTRVGSQSAQRTPKDLSFFDQTITKSYSVGVNASWEMVSDRDGKSMEYNCNQSVYVGDTSECRCRFLNPKTGDGDSHG